LEARAAIPVEADQFCRHEFSIVADGALYEPHMLAVHLENKRVTLKNVPNREPRRFRLDSPAGGRICIR